MPPQELMANKVNHPGIEGHEVYTEVLIKLFEKIFHNARCAVAAGCSMYGRAHALSGK